MTTEFETATVYEDRDNGFTLTLKKNTIILTEAEMSAIVKYELRYSDAYYDSDTYSSSFSADNATAVLTINPFAFGLTESSRRGDLVELIIYDAADYTNGLVWDQFYLVVKADANVPPTS